MLFMYLWSLLTLLHTSQSNALDCTPQTILKEYSIKDTSQILTTSTGSFLFEYEDSTPALKLLCHDNKAYKLLAQHFSGAVKADYEFTYASRDKSTRDEFTRVNSKRILLSRSLFLRENKKWLKAETIHFSKSGKAISKSFFHLGSERISTQKFYNSEGYKELNFTFNYSPSEQKIESFIATDENGKAVKSYNSQKPLQLSSRKNTEPRIMVLDSGFDLEHESIRAYLHSPFIGYNADSSLKLPVEDINLSSQYPPFSHGSFSSSIAMRSLQKGTLFPFRGDPRFLNLQLLADFVLENRIQVANLSFYLPESPTSGPIRRGNSKKKQRFVSPPSLKALELLDVIKQTAKTLWVIAAGNGPMNKGIGVNLDSSGAQMYPASFASENMFVVGSVESGEINPANFKNYKLAKFSNYGPKSVDVLAPGRKLKGATLGGGYSYETGTSFSSPFVVNLIAQLMNIAPDLTPLQAKEIIMKTAYIPSIKRPFPVLSGGIVYPERAIWVAKKWARGSSNTESITDLALRSRFFVSSEDEPSSNEFLEELKVFWMERNI